MRLNPADISRAEQAEREERPIDLDVAGRLRAARLAALKRHRARGTAPEPSERRDLERVERLLQLHRERLADELRRRGPLEVAKALAERRRGRTGSSVRPTPAP